MATDTLDWVTAPHPQVDLGAIAAGVQSSLSLPAGTHAIAIVPASGLSTGRLTVQGVTSGQRYLDTQLASLFTINRYVMVGVVSAYDGSVSISNGINVSCEVVAILDTEAVHVESNPSAPLYTIGAPPTAVTFNVSLANAATQTLIGGVVNLPHRLLRAYVSFDTAPGGGFSIEDGSGNFYWLTAMVGPHPIDFGGLESTIGQMVRLKNYAPGAIFARGFLHYLPGN